MVPLIWVIIFYLLSAIAHIIIHRLLAALNFKSFKSVAIFLIGFFILINISGLGWWLYLYLMLSVLHASLYTSPYLNQRGPSSVILTYVGRKKRVTIDEVYRLFSEKELIGDRLKDLIISGHIRIINGRFVATEKGKILATILGFYRNLIFWQLGG